MQKPAQSPPARQRLNPLLVVQVGENLAGVHVGEPDRLDRCLDLLQQLLPFQMCYLRPRLHPLGPRVLLSV